MEDARLSHVSHHGKPNDYLGRSPQNKLYLTHLQTVILMMEIQEAKRSPQATVLLPAPVPVSADKVRSFQE
jgi:hypothetical protein